MNQTVTTEPGKTRPVEWDQPIAVDNSGESPYVSCDHESGSNFNIGQTPVTCTVSDACGNRNNCTFYVEVGSKSYKFLHLYFANANPNLYNYINNYKC